MKKEIRVIKEITPRMLSVDETAKYIGLATKTIRNRIGRKATKPFPIKPKRIGSRVLFDIKDLDAYLDKLQTT
jgi:predicted DNA-binding transcriptional regulator AlpA